MHRAWPIGSTFPFGNLSITDTPAGDGASSSSSSYADKTTSDCGTRAPKFRPITRHCSLRGQLALRDTRSSALALALQTEI